MKLKCIFWVDSREYKNKETSMCLLFIIIAYLIE